MAAEQTMGAVFMTVTWCAIRILTNVNARQTGSTTPRATNAFTVSQFCGIKYYFVDCPKHTLPQLYHDYQLTSLTSVLKMETHFLGVAG